MNDQEKELERRRSQIIDAAPEEKINPDDYVGTWKPCGFCRGLGKDKQWWDKFGFEISCLRYLQFFPNGDLWFTGDWTLHESWALDQRSVYTVKDLHSWDGSDTVHLYSKVDHRDKRSFPLVKQDDRLYYSWLDDDTYYVLEKISDSPEIEVIR